MSRILLLVMAMNLLAIGCSAFTESYYTTAVFEHAVQGNWSEDSAEDIVRTNLAYFQTAAREAKSKGADMIVFPEFGIFPFAEREVLKQVIERVPDPKVDRVNPCEDSTNHSNVAILKTLSCIAKNYSIVVVANMADIQPCQGEPSCPADNSFHFNTNVAFDSDGSLIGRYHKEHLFFEEGMDLPREPQDPTFRTEFGKFAMFVCFDIVFKHATQLASTPDTEAVLLTTMWIDPTPLMTSVQLWQSWAMGNNVTFLAANIQTPGYSAVGSGLFDGLRGPIAYSYNPDGLSKLIVARVPKRNSSSSPDANHTSTTTVTINGTEPYENDGDKVPTQCSKQILGPTRDRFTDYRCLEEDLSNYTLVKLNDSRGAVHNLCNDGLCCSLDYTASDMLEGFYFGVYNGTYNMFDRYYWSVENCLLVRCDPLDGVPCKTFPMRSNTKFHSVHLWGNFTTDRVYPSILGSGIRLVSVDEWSHQSHPGSSFVNFENDAGVQLIVAGLNGRAYDRDPPYLR